MIDIVERLREWRWVVCDCAACRGMGWQDVENPHDCEACGGKGLVKARLIDEEQP